MFTSNCCSVLCIGWTSRVSKQATMGSIFRCDNLINLERYDIQNHCIELYRCQIAHHQAVCQCKGSSCVSPTAATTAGTTVVSHRHHHHHHHHHDHARHHYGQNTYSCHQASEKSLLTLLSIKESFLILLWPLCVKQWKFRRSKVPNCSTGPFDFIPILSAACLYCNWFVGNFYCCWRLFSARTQI